MLRLWRQLAVGQVDGEFVVAHPDAFWGVEQPKQVGLLRCPPASGLDARDRSPSPSNIAGVRHGVVGLEELTREQRDVLVRPLGTVVMLQCVGKVVLNDELAVTAWYRPADDSFSILGSDVRNRRFFFGHVTR